MLPCCLSVTNPNNPTGRILSEEEMEAVVAAARRADAWILADEVLRLLHYSPRLIRVVLQLGSADLSLLWGGVLE